VAGWVSEEDGSPGGGTCWSSAGGDSGGLTSVASVAGVDSPAGGSEAAGVFVSCARALAAKAKAKRRRHAHKSETTDASEMADREAAIDPEMADPRTERMERNDVSGGRGGGSMVRRDECGCGSWCEVQR